MKEFITCMKKYATFSGRASRREFWMYTLIYLLIGALVSVVGFAGVIMNETSLMMTGFALLGIFCFANIIPSLTVMVRRLHDINKSGWYYFVGFIPFVGAFILLYYMVKMGDMGENMYGASPYDMNSNAAGQMSMPNTDGNTLNSTQASAGQSIPAAMPAEPSINLATAPDTTPKMQEANPQADNMSNTPNALETPSQTDNNTQPNVLI